MVTFKQASRSIGKAVRAADRESKRLSKEADKQSKERKKRQEIANAAHAVRQFEERLALLTGMHKTVTESTDWSQLASQPKPPEPLHTQTHEQKAQQQLDNFQPNLLQRLLGYKARLQVLQRNVQKACKRDAQIHEKAQDEHAAWQAMHDTATGVISCDPQHYQAALQYADPFSDIEALGSELRVQFFSDHVGVELVVNTAEVIPTKVLTCTTTGKLSERDMPKGRYNELYQDYICGALLRVAQEVFAQLPVQTVIVHATADLLNTSTGHSEETCIASARMPRTTMHTLNFEMLDPSDGMKNFPHNMKFSKLKGFDHVEKIGIETES